MWVERKFTLFELCCICTARIMIIFQFYEHQNEHSRSHNRSTEGPIHPPASNDEDESNLEWCCISVTEYRLGWLLRVLHNINRG